LNQKEYEKKLNEEMKMQTGKTRCQKTNEHGLMQKNNQSIRNVKKNKSR